VVVDGRGRPACGFDLVAFVFGVVLEDVVDDVGAGLGLVSVVVEVVGAGAGCGGAGCVMVGACCCAVGTGGFLR